MTVRDSIPEDEEVNDVEEEEDDFDLPAGFPGRSTTPARKSRGSFFGVTKKKTVRHTFAAGPRQGTAGRDILAPLPSLGESETGRPRNSRNRMTVTEGMEEKALLLKSASDIMESARYFRRRAWRGGAQSAAAPMVSGRRTLRLPDLNASKENRRKTIIQANRRLHKQKSRLQVDSSDREDKTYGAVEMEDSPAKPVSSPDKMISFGDDDGGKLEEEHTFEMESEEETELDGEESTPPLLSVLYALVNCSIVLPVMFSFGSIIYHDDFFRPYLAVMMKLTVVSGAVHQIVFSTLSSLPFAVGQVQDAGLIFLSAMATDLVQRLKSIGADDEAILATLTIGLSAYTAVMGAALVLVGKFELASYCQLLPTSVVGGYLAYIGFYCGQAGLALMALKDVGGIAQWYKFFDWEALKLLAPGVVGGCVIYYSLRKTRGHMAVLPGSIILLMVIFYVVLWITGTSVEEATEYGWINKAQETPSWIHTWDFLKPSKVVWSVLPSQIVTQLAMIGVVSLSSSLDIAAIEIEMKRPLDYNHELKTVGISNIVSGLTGGYTGSYIFSQTIFSLRSGIKSRLMGYLLSFFMLVTIVLPINILAYIPNFFFGSLLMLICVDLMFEWLIEVGEKVTPAEHVVVLSTFVLLQLLGVEFGILAGVGVYIVMKKMGYNVGKEEEIEDEGKVEDSKKNGIKVGEEFSC